MRCRQKSAVGSRQEPWRCAENSAPRGAAGRFGDARRRGGAAGIEEYRGRAADSDDEGAAGVLKSGQGIVGVGEGGVQVSEGLGFGSRRRRRGDRRRWTAAQEGGAEDALGEPKAFPDAE